ncbi:Cof-type HAD-IIB family hydrolase [Aerococcus sp. NPDC058936]|uniref:Cof-type HAD-IIB family hydrolase n=1 Tax=Aerococcus sp. NPDC058936 TaxID=3346674 RepID=UPI00366D6E3D
MYKLIAFDIDGTLVNSKKEVTQATKEALHKLHEAGIHVVISSGRPYKGVLLNADLVGREIVPYVSCFNGALVKEVATDAAVYAHELTNAELQRWVDLAREHDLDVHAHDDEYVLVQDTPKDRYVEVESTLNEMPIRAVDFYDGEITAPKVMITAEPGKLDAFIATLDPELFEKYSIMKSEPFFLEIMPKGVDKGEALAKLAESLDIDQSETMAFGDQANDLSMIKWAGCGVAMGNAIDDLKDNAQYVTESNDDEGIAKALEKLVFDAQ